MRRTLIAALAVCCLSASSLAQSARDEGPDRPQNPPANAPERPSRPENPARPERPDSRRDERQNQPRDPRMQIQPGPMRMEKGAYLGISASPAPQVLRRQLGLPNGVGLVVDAVSPKGPAEQAGLKEFDLLHKLNDQVLVNQQQLAVLVRTFKPNDTIKLTVFRDGKSMELSAKLEERDLPPLDQLRLGMDGPFGGGNFFDPFRGDGIPNMPELPGNMRPGARGGGGMAFDPTRPFAPGNLMNEEFNMHWDDGKVQMNLTVKDGKRHLVASAKDGKELYNGPVDTEEQIKGLPPEVRERLPQIGPPGMFRGQNTPRGGIQRPGGQGGEGDRRERDRQGDRPGEGRPGENPSTRPATRDGAGEGGRRGVERRQDL
jgi:hypothetical protein